MVNYLLITNNTVLFINRSHEIKNPNMTCSLRKAHCTTSTRRFVFLARQASFGWLQNCVNNGSLVFRRAVDEFNPEASGRQSVYSQKEIGKMNVYNPK